MKDFAIMLLVKAVVLGTIVLFATYAHASATHGAEIIEKSSEPMEYDICIEVIGDSEEVMAMEGFKSSGYQDDGDYATVTFTKDDVMVEMSCVGGKYLYYKFQLTPIQ